MDVAIDIYTITEDFPPRERFALAQQMRRAAASVASNIAEGYGRRTHKQTFAFLEQSLGSLFELETQLELSHRLHFVTDERFNPIDTRLGAIGRGIHGLMNFVLRDPEVAARP